MSVTRSVCGRLVAECSEELEVGDHRVGRVCLFVCWLVNRAPDGRGVVYGLYVCLRSRFGALSAGCMMRRWLLGLYMMRPLPSC